MEILTIRKRANAVERVARTAATPSRAIGSASRFLVLVAVIVVAGSMLVGFAWAERQYEYPTLFDSWENAYAVFDCQSDTWLDPFESLENATGIRTRDDGVIYIEPSVESATGSSARLELFLDSVGATIDDTSLMLPGGATLSEDAVCASGEDAMLQVMRWDAPVADFSATEIRTENLAATRFLGDQQAFVIALAPAGSTIPAPANMPELTLPLETAALHESS